MATSAACEKHGKRRSKTVFWKCRSVKRKNNNSRVGWRRSIGFVCWNVKERTNTINRDTTQLDTSLLFHLP